MGEYATFKGEQIKIGTCEDMYYLRADQARKVEVNRSHGDTDPVACADGIRFRFPFPDEDQNDPGNFENPFRAIFLWDVKPPAGFEHYNVQFTSQNGYLTSLPCPESSASTLQIHRNGFRGYVGIVQQRKFNGTMVLVAQCGGCNAKYRYETLEEAREVIDACIADAAKADHRDWVSSRCDGPVKPSSSGNFLREVARRIEAGYTSPLPWEMVTA